jgi:hypothetical protein
LFKVVFGEVDVERVDELINCSGVVDDVVEVEVVVVLSKKI